MGPMRRTLTPELERWLGTTPRKALVLRGARQVGKTWLVRDLARRAGLTLIEVNLERNPELARPLLELGPQAALADLTLDHPDPPSPDRCLLFLDEVQEAPEVLARLRWFTEELPELAVVAAGSLLEFALAEHAFSMPVGRITYRFVEPLAFDEFLMAHGEAQVHERLLAWEPGEELTPTLHARAMESYDRFAMTGGMPAVVEADTRGAEPAELRGLQSDLVQTYRDDFAKYAQRLPRAELNLVLASVAAQLGSKFVYARVDDSIKHQHAKRALELLRDARVITLASHSHATGIPLGATADTKRRKAFFLDVGLAHALMNTPAGAAFPAFAALADAVRGALAEQLVAQQVRAPLGPRGAEPVLHYWQRSGGRAGELDFVLQLDQRIVPVEVKSGSAGKMKSLHQFMADRALDFAVRIDRNPPSVQDLDLTTTQGDPVRYRLLSLPGYLLFRLTAVAAAAR